MSETEKKSFTVEPEEGYGDRDERLERTFSRPNLPLDFEPFLGQIIVFLTEGGREMPAVVKFIDEDILIVDFNHPLAGRSLVFDVEVSEVNESPSLSAAMCGSECCCA